MSEEEKATAEAEVQKMLPAFNYDALVAQVNDAETMKQKFADTEVGYEKIQLFRVIKGKHQDDVISKFINESYHIEN